MDDVLLNKGASIERCLRRVNEEYQGSPERLANFTFQDAIVLNIERACQAAIDMAMYIVARDNLGVPQNTGDGFDLLARAGIIDEDLARRLRAMVGFRNVAVHEYQTLDPEILRHVVEHRLSDFVAYCAAFGITIRP